VIFDPARPGEGRVRWQGRVRVGGEGEPVRRGAGTQRRAAGLTVGEVLRFGLLRSAVVLAGQAGIGRPVERLNVMTVPEILPWAKAHEFMLTTGYPLPRSAGQLAGFLPMTL
jgi:hypothetical protein